ncbi:polygalacturonase QRT3-like [Magnolia sinica]|uniref:polygalacturonase QRT3-like n=1 Tax=Magnolia sinica TaxID=86752 RepID=UPI00265ABE70|nr:polygalacturonase QRT3-like [Magnolia sinica]
MPSIKILYCFLLVLWLEVAHVSSRALLRRTVSEYHERFRQAAASRSAGLDGSDHAASVKRRVFYPGRYGADPTGEEDSTHAITRAVHDAFSVQQGLNLLAGVNDLGGVVIDLQGGNYKISNPIRLPSGNGNVVIHGGTLRASLNFPTDGFLIELLSNSSLARPLQSSSIQPTNSVLTPPGYYYEDITFQDILFDSSFRGGGILVVDSVRTRIDNCFFIHFTTQGLLVERGHETFISSSFLGQHLTAGGDPLERNFSGVAIDLASNDNAITDVVIFSAATGIMLRGQANILTGVHCYNKATYWGGVGVYVKLPGLGQTRIDNSYMDYTGIVLEDPVQVHITNAFFLGDAYITLKSVKGQISGLNIVDNMFSGSGRGTPIVKLDGPFTTVDQVVVDRNNVLAMKLKSTIGKRSVTANGTRWVVDFSSDLVFPNRINHLQYSFYVNGQCRFPSHKVTNVSSNVVVVEADREVQGTVLVTVDQNTLPGEKCLFE